MTHYNVNERATTCYSLLLLLMSGFAARSHYLRLSEYYQQHTSAGVFCARDRDVMFSTRRRHLSSRFSIALMRTATSLRLLFVFPSFRSTSTNRRLTLSNQHTARIASTSYAHAFRYVRRRRRPPRYVHSSPRTIAEFRCANRNVVTARPPPIHVLILLVRSYDVGSSVESSIPRRLTTSSSRRYSRDYTLHITSSHTHRAAAHIQQICD